jgi:prepilin-type N-terminal cleavage/methylation domain-containing protein
MALFCMGAYTNASRALGSYLEGVLPMVVVFAAIAFVVEWGVRRWVLGNSEPTAPAPSLLRRRSARLGDPAPKRPRGYTLVEMLVVLAILGLLAGLLFSTTARARGAARQTSCTNNLRQIGMAFRMYLDDYGVRPTQITDLARGGYTNPDILVCPEDATGNHGGMYWEQTYRRGPLPLPTSYIYVDGAHTDDM